MESISLFYPNVYKDEWLAELSKVFSGRWIGQGPLVDEFERQFADKFGYQYCVALNSGTSALELAYHLAYIEPDDKVLAPVFTCTATNIPLVRREANIVFLDINDNLTIDYEDVKQKISYDTKALVAVTLGGLPIDERIFDLAKKYGVTVIIDAAQSLGVSEKYGDFICYSFQAIKHFTTGDGGMLVCRNYEDYQRAKKLRWFGIDREAKKKANWQWLNNHQMTMDIEEAGYKYHMNDIAAAMGIVGLRHSDEALKYRKLLCLEYLGKLTDRMIFGGSCWLFCILTDERDYIMNYLRSQGIECDLVQLRNDIFKVFGGRTILPNMDRIESQYLYLPLHYNLTVENIQHIAEVLNQCKSRFQAAVA